MHTLVVLFHQPRDPDAFRRYYRSVHLPLVRDIPGVRDLRASEDLRSAAERPPYFALFEADFDDESAMQESLTTAEGQAANADLPRFATGGLTVFTYRR